MPPPMSSLVHLIRHGETANPGKVVYASLPGFGLTERGREQARSAATHLANRPIVAVWSSPLQRALETAAEISREFSLPVSVEPKLAEWQLLDRWAGLAWDAVDTAFPGELTAYLSDPTHLEFSPESLDGLARRIAGAITRIVSAGGEFAVVSHQDPIQAARLFLTGHSLSTLQDDKPGHASVITLRPGTPWEEIWATGSTEP